MLKRIAVAFATALMTLPASVQFRRKLRDSHPKIHRVIGRIYVVAALGTGTAGLYMSFFAFGGAVTGLGFGLLAPRRPAHDVDCVRAHPARPRGLASRVDAAQLRAHLCHRLALLGTEHPLHRDVHPPLNSARAR